MFLGLSGGIVPEELIATMAPDGIVFALSNPDPEIHPSRRQACRRGGDRPQRLPEPDQQRAGVPGCVPRRAGRRCPPDHREDEGGRRRGDLRGGGRRPRSRITSFPARWTRASGLPWPRRSRRPRTSDPPMSARRLAVALVALLIAGCGGASGANRSRSGRATTRNRYCWPTCMRRRCGPTARPRTSSRCLTRWPGWTRVRSVSCRASPVDCWTPSRPARRRAPPHRSTATWCRRCPKAWPQATTPNRRRTSPRSRSPRPPSTPGVDGT